MGRQGWERNDKHRTHPQVDVLRPREQRLTPVCLSRAETKPPPPAMFAWGSLCSLTRVHHPVFGRLGPEPVWL